VQRGSRERRPVLKNAVFVSLLLLGAALSAQLDNAQAKFKLVYSFQGGSDGANPQAGLLVISKNYTTNFYGTTTYGGTYDHGTVFKIAPDGRESVLHAFQGDFGGASDGAEPEAGLIKDKSGNLYGTTSHGGDGAECYSLCGTVFQLAPDGTESVLYNFQLGSDGNGPLASLISDRNGNFYGTTVGGAKGEGTVFKLAPDGTETILHAFNFKRDGTHPSANLIRDAAGSFYGTTVSDNGGYHHFGTVFKLAADGTETLLHVFAGWKNNDGAHPYSGLVVDASGTFYGTTLDGGSDCNCGTVFKLAPDGTETVLHAFSGGSDGAHPYAGLVADLSGNLYGTTWAGGADCNCGTVFKLAPDGTETVLYAFTGSDGSYPSAGLILDKHGNLWGTTFLGGTYGNGAVFKLSQ